MLHDNVYDLLMFILISFDHIEKRWSAMIDNIVFTVVLLNASLHIIHPCTPRSNKINANAPFQDHHSTDGTNGARCLPRLFPLGYSLDGRKQ